MVANGRLTQAQLYPVQDGLWLAVGPGRAFKRLQAAAKAKHRLIAVARKAGAYRSLAVQKAIQDAFDSGSLAKRAEWNLDPYSTVRPGDPGTSPHGFGLAVDIVGTDIDDEFRALARRYGFSFPFPKTDPRHAVHDGRTATGPFIVKRPVKSTVYVVRRNDSLSVIAGRYRTTVRQLLLWNPGIEDANRIFVGQKVRVA